MLLKKLHYFHYLVKDVLIKELLIFLGVRVSLRSDDRHVLEKIIFPWISANGQFKRMLFVGCDWYTAYYHRLFPKGEFWTMDFDPTKVRYGAQRHKVGAVQDVAELFPAGNFDVVICNGVLGWGLNEISDIEAAFTAMHQVLVPSGLLVLGWNDVPKYTPVEPDRIKSLGRFNKFEFPPLKSARFLTESGSRHTYSFYRKSERQA